MVNLFRQQIKLAYETAGQPDSVIRRRFLDQTYIPYAEFWKGYVGDSTVYYDEVIRPLLKDSLGMLNRVARFMRRRTLIIISMKRPVPWEN